MPTWYQNLRTKTCSLRLRAFTPGLTPRVLSPISDRGIATQLKVATIILHPFAHLFGELSAPEVAINVLSCTQQALINAGLQTYRTPFGWFNTLQIDAKGHPLSRVARIVTADE
jgi:hypothetical protein